MSVYVVTLWSNWVSKPLESNVPFEGVTVVGPPMTELFIPPAPKNATARPGPLVGMIDTALPAVLTTSPCTIVGRSRGGALCGGGTTGPRFAGCGGTLTLAPAIPADPAGIS